MTPISLRQRNGRWQASFYYDDPASGERKRKQATSPHPQKKASYAWAVALKATLETPPVAAPRRRYTIAELATEYLRVHVSGLKPKTRQLYSSTITHHILPRWGEMHADALTSHDVAAWIAEQREEGAAPRSITVRTGILSGLLTRSVKWDLLDRVPAIDWPRAATPDEPRWLTREECDQLLSIVGEDRDLPTILPVLLDTGLRIGEALALTWACVDLTRREIVVRATYALGEVGTPKSGKSRVVPIPTRAWRVLAEQRLLTGQGELVWCSPSGAHLDYRTLLKRQVDLVADTPLAGIGFHTCRHTYASRLVQLGVPLQRVQILLGHSTPVQTARYAHLSPSDLASSVQLLDGDHTVTGEDHAAAKRSK